MPKWPEGRWSGSWHNIENPVDIQKFDRLGYTFRRDLSSESEYVFERK